MENKNLKLFNKVLGRYRRGIDLEFEKFFRRKIKEAEIISKSAAETIEILREFNLRGGKRARPVLVNVGYFLAGGKDKKAILRASLCAELIHNFFLIHDDIIDRDELRRGKPSLYAFYKKKFGGDLHKGVSFALMAGDVSNVLGYRVLAESDFDEKNKARALGILNKTIEGTCHGEMLEMFLKEKKNVSEEEIEKVLRYKTAYYSFAAPLKIGAALAGGSTRLLDKLEQFALPLGAAFQIQDDILGIFGSREKIGKPICSDIRESQPNLLIFKTVALTKDNPLEKYLGKQEISRGDVIAIRRIVKEGGALDYCHVKAEELVEEAKAMIEGIDMPREEKKFLLGLADFVVRREK